MYITPELDIEEKRKRQARARRTLVRRLLTLLILSCLVTLIYALYIGLTFGWPDWTGFNEQIPPPGVGEAYQHKKTLWDWMELLFVPLVLAVSVFVLNQTERKNADKIAEQRAKIEHEIEDKRSQDQILDTFIDRMAELIIDKQLLKSINSDDVRETAKFRALNALRRLDSGRDKLLVQFLQDYEMIDGKNTGQAIINLSEVILTKANLEKANLQGANLQKANLAGANLGFANLAGANLQECKLYETNLQFANLEGANLQGAELYDANLAGANLQHADMSNTRLQKAVLVGAKMQEANLQEAFLASANMEGAWLGNANLQNIHTGKAWEFEYNWSGSHIIQVKSQATNFKHASLRGANLQKADLRGTDLKGANLTNADLKDAVIAQSLVKRFFAAIRTK